jgi:dolichol-phosphate mannosyltransferase
MDAPPSLSLIVPVYNEVALLAEAVGVFRTFLERHFADWEIIVVESGSTDGTGDLVDRLARADSRLRIVHEGGRNGFGSALRIGFREARKDLVLMTTADHPFPIEVVLQALPLLDRGACVLSYRTCDRRDSVFRKVQSFIYNHLVRLALGIRVRHVNSAFKLYQREFIQSLVLVSRGWFIDAEIVYWITKLRIPYAEIPVELLERPRGQSSVTVTTAFSLLKELWSFRRIRSRIQQRTPAPPT